jgi:hypothetical protein
MPTAQQIYGFTALAKSIQSFASGLPLKRPMIQGRGQKDASEISEAYSDKLRRCGIV